MEIKELCEIMYNKLRLEETLRKNETLAKLWVEVVTISIYACSLRYNLSETSIRRAIVWEHILSSKVFGRRLVDLESADNFFRYGISSAPLFHVRWYNNKEAVDKIISSVADDCADMDSHVEFCIKLTTECQDHLRAIDPRTGKALYLSVPPSQFFTLVKAYFLGPNGLPPTSPVNPFGNWIDM
jgi:hypothetical protein